ncbi:MAG: hypothetical protein ABJB01_08750 [Rudaea sp.]
MIAKHRSVLAAVAAFFCVVLSATSSLRAEEDDDGGLVVAPISAAERDAVNAADAIPAMTVPLTTSQIVPSEYNGDVRDLAPALAPRYLHTWNEYEEPASHKPIIPENMQKIPQPPIVRAAPMPAPAQNFAGLSFTTAISGGTAGAGWPPDTNGDVGPVYYIQAVNDAWGIFNKNTGTLVAGFTENQLWQGAATGTPCDADNFGDPVAIHDGLADRWVLTDFAFATDGSGNPVAPFYQCFAVSKSSDPIAGGWYLYAVQMDTGTTGAPPTHTFTDYPKFGLWTDCLYMGANGFNNDSGSYAGPVFAAFDRTALFAGSPLTASNSSVGFFSSGSVFGMFPANLQGTSAGSKPPSGTAEYFVSESGTAFAFEVRKFQAGATACGAGSTLSTPTIVSQASYGYPASTNGSTTNIVAQPGVTRKLDSLGDELMQRVVYRKLGSAESLWVVHTTCGTTSSTAGTCATNTTLTQPQWAQINVSGGTVNTTPVQQQIYNPGGGLYRWMGSLAVDGKGNMAVGYSTSGTAASSFPSIAYSGRLVTDTLNQLPQTEVQLAAGLGSQNTCGTSCGPISRWGDYSAMTIDPADDCTFWYTNMYYATSAHSSNARWDTQIGSFKFPGCTSSVTFDVTATVSGGNGTITPASQTVTSGATASFTVTPNTGYHVATVTGDTCTVTQSAGTTWKSNAITANCAVTATFAITTYTVTAAVSGGNGTITPPTQIVNSGSAASFAVTPDTGYHVNSVTGDTCTVTQGAGTTWTSSAITSNCVVTATFAITTYTVTASVASGNGTITPPTQIVNSGSAASFTVTPDSGFHVVSVTGDTCTPTQGIGTTWASGPITANCTVSATFAIDTFTVTASVATGNGTVAPLTQTVNSGTSATLTITPNSGFLVQSVVGDTCIVSLTGGTIWTTNLITANCAITVTFAVKALVFTTQPSNVVRGAALGTIVVTEEDASGNTIDDNATVDFTIAACGGTVDLGSVAMDHGVATLTSAQKFYTVASGLQIQASAGVLSGMSQTFAVTANSDILFADGFDGCRL